MSGVVQFIGEFATDWLSASECRARKSAVQLYRVRDAFSAVLPGVGVVTVPRGFVTNMASVPWFAQSYVGTESPPLNFPAVFHDYLYSLGGRLGERVRLTREQVDKIFYDMLLACGMRPTQAWVVHKAVRLRGGAHWQEEAA